MRLCYSVVSNLYSLNKICVRVRLFMFACLCFSAWLQSVSVCHCAFTSLYVWICSRVGVWWVHLGICHICGCVLAAQRHLVRLDYSSWLTPCVNQTDARCWFEPSVWLSVTSGRRRNEGSGVARLGCFLSNWVAFCPISNHYRQQCVSVILSVLHDFSCHCDHEGDTTVQSMKAAV